MVGLERTFYNFSEAVGEVEICAVVYNPTTECPINFPFDLRVSVTNSTAGTEFSSALYVSLWCSVISISVFGIRIYKE